jgi:hypothetical protein
MVVFAHDESMVVPVTTGFPATREWVPLELRAMG